MNEPENEHTTPYNSVGGCILVDDIINNNTTLKTGGNKKDENETTTRFFNLGVPTLFYTFANMIKKNRQ